MKKNNQTFNVINENDRLGNNLRVAVYTRVSTYDQMANGVGLDAQYNKIINVINNTDNYTFNEKLNYYREGDQSGAKEHRPELDRMIRDIDNGEIDIIIVYKVDRLFRKLLYLLQFIDKVSKKGVYIRGVEDNIDTSNVGGMFQLQILGLISELERDNIRVRTIDGKITKAKAKYYVGGGKSAFGYDFVREPGGVKLSVNKDEAIVVNRIFDLYVNKRKSLGKICEILTKEGIPTRDDRIKNNVIEYNEKIDNYKKIHNSEGDEFSYKKGTKKDNDGIWYGSSLRKILRNTMYIGYTEYGKTRKVWDNENSKYFIVENEPENIIQIPCQEILKDKGLFEEAGKLLDKNIKSKISTSKYIFTGLIKCGKCKYGYNGYTNSKGLYSYRCKGGTASGNLKERCKCPEVSEKNLFEYCWNELKRNLSNADIFEGVSNDKEKNKENIRLLNRRISDLDKLITSKSISIQNAEKKELEAIDEKTAERYRNYISDFLGEIREWEVEKIKIQKKISDINYLSNKYKDINDFNRDNSDVLKDITDAKKIGLMRKYISKIIRNPGKIKVEYNYIDKFDGKDWRDGDNGENKKLKSKNELKIEERKGLRKQDLLKIGKK